MKSIGAEKNPPVVRDHGFCLHQNEENTWPSSVTFWLLWPGGKALRGSCKWSLRRYVCAFTTELDLFASCSLSSVASPAAVGHTRRTSPVFLNTARFPARYSWQISACFYQPWQYLIYSQNQSLFPQSLLLDSIYVAWLIQQWQQFAISCASLLASLPRVPETACLSKPDLLPFTICFL